MLNRKLFKFFISGCFLVATSAIAKNREGVSSEIKAESLQGLEDWLHQTKIDLDRNIDRIEKLDFSQQENAYRLAIDNILSHSKGDVEFLTRNILYRTQEMHDLLKTVPASPKRDAFARRFLAISTNWASDLAPLDIQIVRSDRAVNIAGRIERVQFGLEWAQKMVDLSFSLPTNESHSVFLQKVMGFLYNDIIQDDRYNRYLANVAAQFLDRYRELERAQPTGPLEHLQNAKDLREFLVSELQLAYQSIGLDQKPEITPPDAAIISERSEVAAFNSCVDKYKQNHHEDWSMNRCIDLGSDILNKYFINNVAFDSCIDRYKKDNNPTYSINRCLDLGEAILNKYFINNAAFNSCVDKYKQNHHEDWSMNRCIDLGSDILNKYFINNVAFDSCIDRYKKDNNPTYSINKCLDFGYTGNLNYFKTQ